MAKALEKVHPDYPNMDIILAMSPALHDGLVTFAEQVLKPSFLKIRIVRQDINRALKGCDLAIVTSGTATLETALMEIPMIIVYRVSLLTSWIGKRVIKVPHIGLVNLVAEKRVVPELVQKEVDPVTLAEEIDSLLQNQQRRREMSKDLRMVRDRLGGRGASEKTARIALDMIDNGLKPGRNPNASADF
jgi:lipid-A-disaccharide synthase